MNVVDSSAWLSYFAGDANATAFSIPIENLEELIVPSITITEVFKYILRQRDEDMALQAIAIWSKGMLFPLIVLWLLMPLNMVLTISYR